MNDTGMDRLIETLRNEQRCRTTWWPSPRSLIVHLPNDHTSDEATAVLHTINAAVGHEVVYRDVQHSYTRVATRFVTVGGSTPFRLCISDPARHHAIP